MGTVSMPDPFLVQLAGVGEWQRCRRAMQGRCRPIISYYVLFDEQHDDGSCDGPYRGGEIDERNLELIE